jgi:hypothetical protein
VLRELGDDLSTHCCASIPNCRMWVGELADVMLLPSFRHSGM